MLISFVFNVGIGTARGSKMMKAIEEDDYDEAVEQLLYNDEANHQVF